MKRILPLLFIFCSSVLFAQEEEGSSAAQANNPLANMTALNFHDYYIPKLADASGDAYMNTAWIRFAKPLAGGKLLFRLSVPMSTVGMPNGSGAINSANGLGDINAFLAYSFVSNATTTVGAGPLLAFPTASDDALGAGKWQGGMAFVAFVAKSPVIQFGGLVTWQTSFAGDEDRNSTNMAAVQPFYFFQLGQGTYLRGAPIWAFDIENEAFHMPIALGIGKVVKAGNTVLNLFIEPQYSMLHKGTQPQFQVLTGINLQFVGQ
ncbi:hypothetical protein INQ51_09275 [Maribellus sp. CM-23]|uniref:hypothetical protein n=1 Tax=Maribellus sp. CM-23 TaxID=2781026 RepID=UPI001F3E039B|nr:hypothetical protein [Maribellus sp. CM-23]MCE4564501.1 hypothetical protein [Maribellus sp. CM-23]